MAKLGLAYALAASGIGAGCVFGCGEDEATNRAVVVDDSGTDTGGSRDASASGGSGGTGARGSGGRAGLGGVNATGGRAGASVDGGDADAGARCTPRAQVPAPIPRTASIESTCQNADTCGGALAGTKWDVESVCVDESSFLPQLASLCAGSGQPAFTGTTPKGTVSFTATDANVSITMDFNVGVDFPNSCGHGCRCTDFESQLTSAGLNGSCNPVCNGGSCFCTIRKTLSLSSSGAYTATGGSLSMPSHPSMSYCISGGVLTLSDSTASYKLRPPAALQTPEICDGIDNDGNGTADDDIVECSTCSTVGACAGGVDQTCSGSSGWSCTYTSPDWERDETKCDAIDNDCDGETNEGLDCKEFCDGIDNDAKGGVDDNPVSGPTCTTVGACASGNVAQCKGAAGWACTASATTFEAAETKCDGVDNDCNGLTDERCCAPTAARMYYAYIDAARTGAFVARSDLSGGNRQNLVTLGLATLIDVSVDSVGGKIYWGNLQAGVVQRANLNGTNVEPAALPASSQPRVALDVAHRFIFWASATGVRRANLDNLANAVDIPIPVTPLTMTVDSQHGWLYLGSGNLVHRANFDGSDHISIGDPMPVPEVGQVIEGLAVDQVSSKVYWTSTGGIHRANLDLTSPEKLITLNNPHHVHIDQVARRLYWSETVSNDFGYMDIGGTTPSYVTTDFLSLRLGDIVPCAP
jgi:hypothetical protein